MKMTGLILVDIDRFDLYLRKRYLLPLHDQKHLRLVLKTFSLYFRHDLQIFLRYGPKPRLGIADLHAAGQLEHPACDPIPRPALPRYILL